MTQKARSISIILPVLHEGGRIRDTVADLLARNADDRTEIIIVDGDPEAGTLRALGHSLPVKTVRSAPGRARQMNAGAAVARGDILLFLHADTRLPDNTLGLIREALADPRFVAGAFALGFATPRKVFRITEHYVRLRTRITGIPFGDQALCITRECFASLGGFREIPLMEDVDLAQRIRRRGGRIALLPQQVLTSARRYEQEGIVRCTLRNWTLQTLYCLGMPPERLARWYRP